MEMIEPWRLLTLLAFLGGMLGVWVWSKRGGNGFLPKVSGKGESQLKVCEKRWLGSKTMVYLLEVDGERFLLADSNGRSSWQRVGGGGGEDFCKSESPSNLPKRSSLMN